MLCLICSISPVRCKGLAYNASNVVEPFDSDTGGHINNHMRITQIITEGPATKVTGTNCGNCIWFRNTETKTVDSKELNSHGGLHITNDKDLKNAKSSDLVTLPGAGTVKTAAFCKHQKVNQWVTERMCCIFWDAPGVLRDFGKMSLK